MTNMIKQFLRAKEDFLHNWFINIIIIINIIILLYASNLLFFEHYYTSTAINDVNKEEIYEDSYLMKSTREEGNYNHNNIYKSDSNEKNKKFYSFLKTNFDVYSFLLDYEPNETIESIGENIDSYFVDDKFCKLFLQKKLQTGEMFSEYDYSNKDDITPTIVGYNYIKKFKIGDIIDNKYVVKGFLKQNSKYYNLKYTYAPIEMDDKIFLPLNPDKFNFISVSMLIDNTFITEKNLDRIQLINEEALKLGLKPLVFIAQKNNLKILISERQGLLNYRLFYEINVIIIVSLSLFCFSYIKILSNKKKYFINILYGATKLDIFIRITIQNLFILFISGLIFSLFIKSFIPDLFKIYFPCMFLVLTIVLIVLSISICSIMRKKDIWR